jgi:hypothetical protein
VVESQGLKSANPAKVIFSVPGKPLIPVCCSLFCRLPAFVHQIASVRLSRSFSQLGQKEMMFELRKRYGNAERNFTQGAVVSGPVTVPEIEARQ